MNSRCCSLILVLTSTALQLAVAVIPSQPIATKTQLLFEDDMEGTQHDARWHRVVDSFVFENGVLKGSQTREKDAPAAKGKPARPAHDATYGLELPTKDSVVEAKIKFGGCTMIDVEFDDRKFDGSHYGHICRAQIRLDSVSILDERDGKQSNALLELSKNPAKNQARIDKIIDGHSANFPVSLQAGKWYNLAIETVGDAMRVTIDGAPVAFYSSPGIGHKTKTKIELGVKGKNGFFDDIKVWNASPPVATSAATPTALTLAPNQPLLETFSQLAPNASAWVLAALDEGVPPNVRQNLTYLREDLLDEYKQKPKASQDAYKLAHQLCSTMIAALDERDQTLVRAGFRAVQADANTAISGNQALNARRNYMMSWPQYAREKSQRAELRSAAASQSQVMKEQPKVDWSNRTAALRKTLDDLYAQFREALRQSPAAK